MGALREVRRLRVRRLVVGEREAVVTAPVAQQRLTVVPLHLREANDVVAQLHRHHKPCRTHKFSVGVVDESGAMRGVAIANRPVARHMDDGRTLEVARVATDGCPNACSALYGAVRRVAKAMGYKKVITYTLCDEPGTSLRAAGWTQVATVRGRSWSCPSRPRDDAAQVLGDKRRWETVL